MASIVDNPTLLNDLKRKQPVVTDFEETKKPRFDTDEEENTNGNQPNGDTGVKCNNETAPIDLSKINTASSEVMEVEENDDDKIISPDDIRKLKELLRQEEAKLQLIKR